MSTHERKYYGHDSKRAYETKLRQLQIELVKLQRHLIAGSLKILVIFEGRDSAGKDGTIKRIIKHLSPRETRVVALGKPSDRDRGSWYFQRFAAHLPAEQEMVLMNRSWYNRAGVERVMGFCSEGEYEDFMDSVTSFESMLVNSGILLLKYYLDISKGEQRRRLEDRRVDPLKQWKISPIDEVALRHWDDYSAARNEMLTRTHNVITPWNVVKADNKRRARLNVIRHLLSHIDFPHKDEALAAPNDEIVFTFEESRLARGDVAA